MKVEGTVVLDGLVEGTLPAEGDVRVREWVEALGPRGLDFDLQVDGDSFSLLPSSAPVPVARLGHRPAEAVKEALEALLSTFPAAERAGVFSTLRSAEVRPGLEVQSVYVVNPAGEVEVRERTVDAETRAQEPAAALKDRVRAAVVAVVVLAALVGVASLVFDLRGALGGLWSKVTPLDASAVEVDASAFERYFKVTKKVSTPEGNGLVLTLERTDAFPKTDEEAAELFEVTRDKTTVDWMRRLFVAEALARGRVHVDLFGKDGAVLGGGDHSVLGLRTKATLEVEVRATRDPRTVRIAIVP